MDKKNIVVIPIHNQLDYLKRCVASVKKNTPNLLLIIVDDASEKDVEKWVCTILNKNTYYLRLDENKGFTHACNKGIDFAMQFDFQALCLLNSDTEIVTDKWFRKVLVEMNPDTGMAGVVSDNATFQSVSNPAEYLKNIENRKTLKSMLVHGFCCFISKELISTIGHLDHSFPHYGSEDDYALKAISNGFINVVVTSVFVKHHACKSYTKENRIKLMERSNPAFTARWKTMLPTALEISKKIHRYINS